jgi:hypothetical protein
VRFSAWPQCDHSCPFRPTGFRPLQAIDFIGYSGWHYCGVALGHPCMACWAVGRRWRCMSTRQPSAVLWM